MNFMVCEYYLKKNPQKPKHCKTDNSKYYTKNMETVIF